MTDERTPQINIPRKIVSQFADVAAGTPEGEPDELDAPWEQGTFDDQVELTGGVTIVGTNEPDLGTSAETVDNYYMHELGHVLGAIHPSTEPVEDDFEVPSGTNGVMCKTSCTVSSFLPFGDEGDILTAEFYSSENKNRILNLNYDYKDDEGPPESGGENIARNISSVSTAATTNP